MTGNARHYPRVAVAVIGRCAGAFVTTSNLSMGGAQLVCPSMSYALAERRLKVHGDGVPLELELGVEGGFASEARVVYVDRAGDEYLIGVEFANTSDDARARLERFVSRTAGADATRAQRDGDADQ